MKTKSSRHKLKATMNIAFTPYRTQERSIQTNEAQQKSCIIHAPLKANLHDLTADVI